ncbi:hypothetical protein EJ071_33670 [Mesorhizobium sp. M1B.F.Ca.ET.045.04.1.1]|nr:hypothetical protein EJ071_33670 [Mesorhizobium sp. M1B.F.Ca.ET.045.04.1.1]
MTDAVPQECSAEPSTALTRRRRRGVLFVIGTLDLGGTESQLVLLAKGLKKRGWKVEVFVLSRGGVLAETLDDAGIRISYGLHRPNPSPALPVSTKGVPNRAPLRRRAQA